MILRRPVFIPPPSQTRLFDQHKEFWGNPADNIKDRWKLTDKIPFSLFGPPVDYTYLRTSTPIYSYMSTYISKYAHTHITTSAYIYIYLRIHTSIHVGVHTHTHIFIYLPTYTYIYIYLCVCFYIHVYTHTHTPIWTHISISIFKPNQRPIKKYI